MVFFLSLRESTRRPGTIEPDILPSLSSQVGLGPRGPKSILASTASSFREYITTWDFSDRPAVLRRLACILALSFHVPLNILSILSHGISVLMFVWILLSLLNLIAVAYSLWRLDDMQGQRLFYSKLYVRSGTSPVQSHPVTSDTRRAEGVEVLVRDRRLIAPRLNRRHFDYVVLGLLFIYGFSFFIFLFANLGHGKKIAFLRVIWPGLVMTDIACFVAGWVATWRDVGAVALG